MSIRFLADEDVDANLLRGLQRREPAIDILDVKTSGLRETADPELLELAAQQDRIVITSDRNTMIRHFRTRLAAGLPAPGMFVVPQGPAAAGEIIDCLLLVWTASRPDE